MYAELDTLVEYDDHELRKAYPDTSFPTPIPDETLESLGLVRIIQDPRPTDVDELDLVTEGKLRQEGRHVYRGWVTVPLNEEDLYDLIASKRYEVETSGTTHEGQFLNTERDSQALLAGATLAALTDPDYTCRWKLGRGVMVTLDATQLKAMAATLRNYVQACFDREADLIEHVKRGTFTVGMLDKGWPEKLTE